MNIVINDFVGDAAFTGFGEATPLKKRFEWQTDLVKFDNRKEQRNQILEQPVRHWTINWSMMDLAARNKLIELYNRAKGRFDTFLYADKDDFETALTDWEFIADGGETTTQLQKEYFKGESESWTEDKKDIQPSAKFAPIVKIDAVTKTEGTHFTLDDTTGIIDWTSGSAPNGALANGEVVTANYYFYFRVRFDFDIHEDIMQFPDLYDGRGLEIIEDIS